MSTTTGPDEPAVDEIDGLRHELARAQLDAARWRRSLYASQSMAEQNRHATLQVQRRLQRTIEELARDRDRAEQANAAKDRAIAITSHELRTPLHGVIGTIDLLTRTDLDHDQRELTEVARQSATALLRIIDDLLDVAKADADALRLESIPFDVRTLVRDSLDALRATAELKGIAIRGTITDDVPRCVLGDPSRLRQVLTNLLGNGVKFTASGEVRVHVHRATNSTQLVFRVEDTGIGIPESALPDLFAAFRQAEASTSRLHGGTGLGLVICKRLVELMGGRIEVRSAVGVGTTFEFAIDLTPAPDDADPEGDRSDTPTSDLAAGRARRHALLVDDHQVNRLIAGRMLHELGFEVTSACDGHEAVRVAPQRAFDIILMDCSMPGLDGFAATRAIREREGSTRRTPIVALTASVMAEDRERCRDAGMDDYVAKPMRLLDLRAVVQRVLGTTCDA